MIILYLIKKLSIYGDENSLTIKLKLLRALILFINLFLPILPVVVSIENFIK